MEEFCERCGKIYDPYLTEDGKPKKISEINLVHDFYFCPSCNKDREKGKEF